MITLNSIAVECFVRVLRRKAKANSKCKYKSKSLSYSRVIFCTNQLHSLFHEIFLDFSDVEPRNFLKLFLNV